MSKKKQTSKSARKKTEKSNSEERSFVIRKAAPDDPIFTRGFIIGGRYPRRRLRGSGDERRSRRSL